MDDQIAKIKSWLGTGSINIFGVPMAGKDTQGQRLAKLLGASLFGGGHIIRNSNREDIKQNTATGRLAPKDEYLAMVTPYFAKPEFKNTPLILSSAGRWHGEEEAILSVARASGHDLKAVIFLNMPEVEVIKRWEAAQDLKDRGVRDDDVKDALEVRLQEFRNKTRLVIDYYKQKGILIEVNGNQPREKVTTDILAALAKLSS